MGLEDLDSRFKDVINTAAFDIITSNAASGETVEKTPSAPWLMKEALSVKAAVDEAVRGVGTCSAGLTKAPAFESGATGAGAHPPQQDEKAVPEEEVVSEVTLVFKRLCSAGDYLELYSVWAARGSRPLIPPCWSPDSHMRDHATNTGTSSDSRFRAC